MKLPAKVLFFLAMFICLGTADSSAGWIENGVPVTSQLGSATGGAVVSDGASGAIVVYEAYRLGIPRILAQRVSSSGDALWGEDGTVILVAPWEHGFPQVIADGAGGAILTWEDERSGGNDVYAQRVDASGAITWSAGGILICAATGEQSGPQIVSDGAGGAVITWEDARNGNDDVYAQRVNASGEVQWAANGVAVCTALLAQYAPQIASDGDAGAIITWRDYRNFEYRVYAQRVNGSGAPQWALNGIPICVGTASQYVPLVISDGAGGAIVSWRDYRNGNSDIYAQRVNASGALQWAAGGVAVCTAAASEDYHQSVSDGAGGAIITWHDDRSGNLDIYAQRVNASGGVEWTADGVAICTAAAAEEYPKIASDGSGGAIVAWHDDRGGNFDVYAQRLNGSGISQWAADGASVCSSAGNQWFMSVVSDDAGGAIMTMSGSWDGAASSDIRAQRMNGSGAVQWAADGVASSTATGGQAYPQIASDGAGGAIVAWMDSRWGNYDIYAQRVDASGSLLWGGDGVAICTALGDYEPPNLRIISDGAGGAIMTWEDYRVGGYNHDIYAQRVDASGAVQWSENGVVVCSATESQWHPDLVSDGAGGAIITWYDHRGSDYDIYAQRVSASGEVQWAADGVALCTEIVDQAKARIASDGAGGAIVAWMSPVGGFSDIYAQRVNASGEVQWTANGDTICSAIDTQDNPQLVSDGAGGAIITWEDGRNRVFANDDIYAQRVNASGAAEWPRDGILVSAATAIKELRQIISDGAGGAIILWDDFSTTTGDIYAQRVAADGELQWTANGADVSTAPESQVSAQMTSDCAGGAVITWKDYRNGNVDVYSQRLNALGAAQWAIDGIPICTAPMTQWNARIASDGAGGAIIAWDDDRSNTQGVCVQRVTASGGFVATLLRNYTMALSGSGIRLNWSLSRMDAGARFVILRASAPDWKYEELGGVPREEGYLSYFFVDGECLAGSTHKYRVDCETEGSPRRILFETEPIAVPAIPIALYQNHPNPFNPRTLIRFYLPVKEAISLNVYDVAGRLVARLAEGIKEKGYHEVTWDGRNSSGATCSSGIYFSRLKAGKETISRKMVLIK